MKSFHSKYNVSGYSNPKADQLIDRSTETLDVNKRIPIYYELFKELKDDPPVLLLSYLKILSAHNARIQGISPDPVSILNRSIPKLKIQ
ncbi:hypothetical protein LJK87_10270 [Paenibacillus sp. P25]|nr:hypothetical protein LJK87_10270 [Paenibacillus sp. P25]